MPGNLVRRTGAILAAIVLVASAAWGAWAILTERAVRLWLDARAAEGWLVNHDEIGVTGYPLAFRTRIAALELADPETGWLWSLPELRLESPAFRPDRIRVVLPPDQHLASPEERLTILSETMAADLDVRPGAAFALDALEAGFGAVRVESDAGWAMTLPEARLAVTREAATQARYDVTFTARDLTPPGGLRARLDPADLLPEAVETVDYAARMAFDRPWDLRAIAERRPQITALDLAELEAVWGGLAFRAAGGLEVDAGGVPEGELALRAENWREMVAMAERAGVFPAQMRGAVEGMLEVVAGLAGDPEVIDARLRFADGRTFLGPLPVGPAPILRLR